MSSLTPIVIHAVPHPDLGGTLPPVLAPPTLPLPQTRLWRDTVELLGGHVQALGPAGLKGFATVARLPGARAALGPVVRVARGARGLTAETARALRSTLGRRHLIVHGSDPEEARILAGAGFHQIAPARQIAGLFIDRRPKELLRAMSPDWRSRLRAATGAELAVHRSALPPDPRHWIFERWDGAQPASCRGDDAALSPRVIATMTAADPGAGQLFSVTRDGRRLAAMLVLRHGAGATCAIAWTTEAGRAASAGHLCLWRAMLQLRELGVTWLDLGPADWRRDAATARFFSGAGASLHAHGGAWLDSAWLPRRRPGRAPGPDTTFRDMPAPDALSLARGPEPALRAVPTPR
jgi:hypothetical protein